MVGILRPFADDSLALELQRRDETEGPMATTLTMEATPRQQIQSEYLEMPGLRLTVAQAARLWHLRTDECEQTLAEMVAEGFLRRSPSGQFSRRDSDTPS
jgi:hypothetical protein